jgi:hypothetical protein
MRQRSWTGLALRQAQGEAHFSNLMVSPSNHEVGATAPRSTTRVDFSEFINESKRP